MDFTGKLGKYKIIETEDQTKTLWSEFFDENCHNLAGAYEETIHNYILGCHIPEQLQSREDVHVLDVGFGLGIGLKALLDEVKKNPDIPTKKISYTSIELDEDLFLWAINETFPDVTFTKKDQTYISEIETLAITIYIGDGRLTLPEAHAKNLLPKFTAIFQDAFSPKRNPALWRVEWFVDLLKMSSTGVYLSTYSASVSVRKSMVVAGWIITNAKGFGQKRTMTKARLTGVIDPALQAELSRSPTLELRDN
jgi:chorismate dehydratase